MPPRSGWDDERVDQILGNLLRGGVILAAAVVLAGGIVYLARHGPNEAAYHVCVGDPAEVRKPFGIVSAVLEGRGRGIIQLGLLLLIATPVARVLFSVFAFFFQRDYTYVFLTVVVFVLLLFSLFD